MATMQEYITDITNRSPGSGNEDEVDPVKYHDLVHVNNMVKGNLGRIFNNKKWSVIAKPGGALRQNSTYNISVAWVPGQQTSLARSNSKMRVDLMAHLTNNSGKFTAMSKVSFESIGHTYGGLKFRKITGKTLKDAAQKVIKWMEKWEKVAVDEIGLEAFLESKSLKKGDSIHVNSKGDKYNGKAGVIMKNDTGRQVVLVQFADKQRSSYEYDEITPINESAKFDLERDREKILPMAKTIATISRVKLNPENPIETIDRGFGVIRKGKWTPVMWYKIHEMIRMLDALGIKLQSVKGIYMGMVDGKGIFHESEETTTTLEGFMDKFHDKDKGKKLIAQVVYFSPLKDGKKFAIAKRETNPNIKASQDGFDMWVVNDKNIILKYWGSHPSKEGAKKMMAKKINEGKAKFTDNDWVIIKSAGSFDNPEKDEIVGYVKHRGGPNTAPTTKPGQKGMRIAVAKKKGYAIQEDAEATGTATGSIPQGPESVGVKPDGTFGGKPVFDCDCETFSNCIKGKKKHGRWASYLGDESPFYNTMKTWMKQSYKNNNFILRNKTTGEMVHARNPLGESVKEHYYLSEAIPNYLKNNGGVNYKVKKAFKIDAPSALRVAKFSLTVQQGSIITIKDNNVYINKVMGNIQLDPSRTNINKIKSHSDIFESEDTIVSEDAMFEASKPKTSTAKLVCMECGKKFKKSKPSATSKCPKCGGSDLELESVNEGVFDRIAPSRAEMNAVAATFRMLDVKHQSGGLKNSTLTLKHEDRIIEFSRQEYPFEKGTSFYDIRLLNKNSSKAVQSKPFSNDKYPDGNIVLLKGEIARFVKTILKKEI